RANSLRKSRQIPEPRTSVGTTWISAAATSISAGTSRTAEASERARRALFVELVPACFEHVVHVVVGEAEPGRMEVLGVTNTRVASAAQDLVGNLCREHSATVGHLAGEHALRELVFLSHDAADALGITRIVDPVHDHGPYSQHAFGTRAVGLEVHRAHHALL